MNNDFSIRITNPEDEKAIPIIAELSENLLIRFGSDGRNSFTDWENENPKFIFVLGEINSEVIGCGAIRPVTEDTGEVKRMYAKYRGKKIGKKLLEFLENQAKHLNYTKLILETRLKNEEAISFYQSQGYSIIPNYGKYVNRPEAICLGKSLK